LIVVRHGTQNGVSGVTTPDSARTDGDDLRRAGLVNRGERAVLIDADGPTSREPSQSTDPPENVTALDVGHDGDHCGVGLLHLGRQLLLHLVLHRLVEHPHESPRRADRRCVGSQGLPTTGFLGRPCPASAQGLAQPSSRPPRPLLWSRRSRERPGHRRRDRSLTRAPSPPGSELLDH
jgi:hypothetical protein